MEPVTSAGAAGDGATTPSESQAVAVIVVRNVLRNGTLFAAGATLTLSLAEAAPLLALGAIRAAPSPEA
ncbi:MAG: hypothetical protein EAZ99_03980 [Alphaproteobacteria bacterium]|nr:MAG: hypothetical protein EAZ99_03980 [Alphaproteobacteria bacterium]